MDKINWQQKLSSRKFQGMIINLITNILIAFRFPENEIAQIVAIVVAALGVVAYIFAEGKIDAERAKNPPSEIN